MVKKDFNLLRDDKYDQQQYCLIKECSDIFTKEKEEMIVVKRDHDTIPEVYYRYRLCHATGT
jgi:hypothetical protein